MLCKEVNSLKWEYKLTLYLKNGYWSNINRAWNYSNEQHFKLHAPISNAEQEVEVQRKQSLVTHLCNIGSQLLTGDGWEGA